MAEADHVAHFADIAIPPPGSHLLLKLLPCLDDQAHFRSRRHQDDFEVSVCRFGQDVCPAS